MWIFENGHLVFAVDGENQDITLANKSHETQMNDPGLPEIPHQSRRLYESHEDVDKSIDITVPTAISNQKISMKAETSTSSKVDDVSHKVPHITHFVKMKEGGEVKLGDLIFLSGKRLLDRKLNNSAKGIAENKYMYAEHVEELNGMYPEMTRYDPAVVHKRVKSYVEAAKAKVQQNNETGQGKLDDQVYEQGSSIELILVSLINDVNKSCIPAPVKPKPYYGASSRYEASGSSFSFKILEDGAVCISCNKPENIDHLEGTIAGLLCSDCMEANQGKSDVLTSLKQKDEELAVQANIEQNQSLLKMKFGDEKEGKKTVGKGKKRTRKYSDDEGDDELTSMLVAKWKKEEMREVDERQEKEWRRKKTRKGR